MGLRTIMRMSIQNCPTPELRKAREILIRLMNTAIESVEPSLAVRRWLTEEEFEIEGYRKVVVVGGGKAGVAMAMALEQSLGDKLTHGIVNIPRGTMPQIPPATIELVEASHPIPDESGMEGARRMLELVGGLGQHDLVICLISGGGSALMPLPAEGVTLGELQEVTHLLLRSGAAIQELNAVRKHLSAIKGGQLARAASPARTVSLIISDVVGDRLDTIASGPTYPDSTTYSDALSVIERYELKEEVPPGILAHLTNGARGAIPETPKAGEECFRKAYYKIIASNADALAAAEEVGRAHGFNVRILTTTMQGEARQVGEYLSRVAREVCETGRPIPRPALLLLGGEATVTVKGAGFGGRNQELVLSAARGIAGLDTVAIVSFSTDGVDGPTNAAGAVADGFTIRRAEQLGLDPALYLENNDSHSFFKELGDLLVTGPTGTNVMDIVGLIVG
ncbi:glycerate kinase [Dehalococcoidia bacterium]|nr:glycerate kinase [Dehalococcoidia bacterium]